MAGTNRFKMAEKVLKDFKGRTFFLEELKGIIRKNLSSDEGTLLTYLLIMRENKLIEELEVKQGVTKWKVL